MFSPVSNVCYLFEHIIYALSGCWCIMYHSYLLHHIMLLYQVLGESFILLTPWITGPVIFAQTNVVRRIRANQVFDFIQDTNAAARRILSVLNVANDSCESWLWTDTWFSFTNFADREKHENRLSTLAVKTHKFEYHQFLFTFVFTLLLLLCSDELIKLRHLPIYLGNSVCWV